MRKITPAISMCSICLFGLSLMAADFWQAKPYTEWSEKDAGKLQANSPWARPFMVSGDAGASTLGARSRASATSQEVDAGDVSAIVARWDSALPLRQAAARLKFGAEAGTAAEAKELVEHEPASYTITVSGDLGPYLRGNPTDVKMGIANSASLLVKGKPALKPTDVLIDLTQARNEVSFMFPRSTPFTLDDKEVEFSAKMGSLGVKYKFTLKSMVVNGKLEL